MMRTGQITVYFTLCLKSQKCGFLCICRPVHLQKKKATKWLCSRVLVLSLDLPSDQVVGEASRCSRVSRPAERTSGNTVKLYLLLNHQSKSMRQIRMMGTPLCEEESDLSAKRL